MCLVRFVVNIW